MKLFLLVQDILLSLWIMEQTKKLSEDKKEKAVGSWDSHSMLFMDNVEYNQRAEVVKDISHIHFPNLILIQLVGNKI
jgi:uncharacterized protein related to proFAR isomerase